MPRIEPERLTPGTDIHGFMPDPNLSWVAVYAATCEDPTCEEGHKRLFIIPVIGWAQIFITRDDNDFDEWRLRPVIMLGDGSVVDYLDMPGSFQFIAVLRAAQDVTELAREIYTNLYGEVEASKITKIEENRLPN